MEKLLKAKELICIPLPKPLQEFTWLSIGTTLIELHKYVSDNNLVSIPYAKRVYSYYNIYCYRAIFVSLI